MCNLRLPLAHAICKKTGERAIKVIASGAKLIQAAARRADGMAGRRLQQWANELAAGKTAAGEPVVGLALDETLREMVAAHDDRAFASRPSHSWRVMVDSELARFSAWYEMFPRSFSPEPGRHGTFKDCEAQLPRIAGMGFDVLYLPPIHPIGRSFRKGKNNNPVCQPDDPGSPWAIGAAEGGHKDVHPQLGTLEDFRRLVSQARSRGVEIALDMAFAIAHDSSMFVHVRPCWADEGRWGKANPCG
jgi:starch synthase (maltosyl-transferring)